jgi:hypothetical protein
VERIWNLTADELRLVVLNRLIATRLETAASTLGTVVAKPGPLT